MFDSKCSKWRRVYERWIRMTLCFRAHALRWLTWIRKFKDTRKFSRRKNGYIDVGFFRIGKTWNFSSFATLSNDWLRGNFLKIRKLVKWTNFDKDVGYRSVKNIKLRVLRWRKRLQTILCIMTAVSKSFSKKRTNLHPLWRIIPSFRGFEAPMELVVVWIWSE